MMILSIKKKNFFILKRINFQANGSVYTFGSNINGKLGAGVLIPNSPSPVLNPYLNGTEIKKVSLTYFALVLLSTE